MSLAENGFPPDGKKLVGRANAFRIRVGPDRILFRVEAAALTIYKIRRQATVYRM